MHLLSLPLSSTNLWCSLVCLLITLFRLVFERDRLKNHIFETLSSIDHYILHKFIDQNVKIGVTHEKKLKGPLPALMQWGRLFLFWNKWSALFGQHSCLAFKRANSPSVCVCVSSSEKWLHNSPPKSVNKYYFSCDSNLMRQNKQVHSSLQNVSTTKMQVAVFIFQICAVAIAFYCFPWNGEGRWWYFEQAKFIDSERVFPWLPKVFHICIQKVKTTYSGYLLNIITT